MQRWTLSSQARKLGCMKPILWLDQSNIIPSTDNYEKYKYASQG